ncbi:hypothetical protein BDV97DRAFT_372359 [Delphinella strobiligena]|nr:hypothetical protein BDV97DRAFT_372359 [Delphinella strobiligena]
MASESSKKRKKPKADIHSFFNNATFSDMKIKFSDQEILAHKSTLSSKSEYFFKAFSGQFPVATSGEIDLGDDDDPEAVRAMIRHIYDLPYDQIADDAVPESAYPIHIDDENKTCSNNLMFHIGVFTVADKYDVPSLRALVVKVVKRVMEASWVSDQFIAAVKATCFLTAPNLADNSLQQAFASFCASKFDDIVLKPTFKAILEEENSLGSMLLIERMKEGSKDGQHLWRCEDCSGLALTQNSAYPTRNEHPCRYAYGNSPKFTLIGGVRKTQA